MMIKIHTDGRCPDGEVSAWVEESLTDAQRDRQMSALEVANACAEAIGRLVAVLAEKGALTAPDVHLVARGYYNDSATFVA